MNNRKLTQNNIDTFLSQAVKECLERKKFSSMQKYKNDVYIRDLMYSIERYLSNGQKNNIIEEFNTIIYDIDNAVEDLDLYNTANYKKFIVGMFYTFKELFLIKNNELNKQEDLTKYLKASIHSKSLLVAINENPGINFTALADKLSLNRPNLSNILNRLEHFNVFTIRNQGRNKYLYVSSKGLQVLENQNLFTNIRSVERINSNQMSKLQRMKFIEINEDNMAVSECFEVIIISSEADKKCEDFIIY